MYLRQNPKQPQFNLEVKKQGKMMQPGEGKVAGMNVRYTDTRGTWISMHKGGNYGTHSVWIHN